MIDKILSGLTAASLLIGMTGCQIEFATPEPAYKTSFTASECPFNLPENLVEGVDVECGTVSVPEDRENPQKRTLRLAVAIFHPQGGASNPEPVVYLAGGPGASALKMVDLAFERNFAPILAAGRDLILFDQRGVGFSEPALDCPEVNDLNLQLLDQKLDGQELTDAEMEALFDAAFRNCEQQLTAIADLGMYNTLASAADVNDLRLALGYEKVNLWGSSYGTRLALEVLRDYPEGVRSAVLDGVYPPDVDLYLETPANLERALSWLFESCAADPACDAAYPDLRNVFFETVASLNENPVNLTISDPISHRVHSVLFDGDTLFSMVFLLLYESQAQPFLPWLLDQAWRGEMDMLGQVFASILANSTLSSRGMMFSVQCNEELSFSTQQQYDEQVRAYPDIAPYLRETVLGDASYEICAFWDSGRAARQENEAVNSEIPTLILQGELDPITPPAWSQHAAETLPNSFYVLFPLSAHGALNSECAWGIAVAFLHDPQQAPDTACIAEMEVLPFYIP